MESTKQCKACGEIKPLSEFPHCQHRGKVEHYARCAPCHRVYRAEQLQRWRHGVRLSMDAEADLEACVAVLVSYRYRCPEDIGVMLGNAAQMISWATYLMTEPVKPEKSKAPVHPSEAMEGGSAFRYRHD